MKLILKRYSVAEYEFISQWVDRWFQLSILIFDLVNFEKTPSPPPPTDMDEITYQELHFWFLDNEDQFTKILEDYYQAHGIALHQGGDEPGMTSNACKYLLNPFRFCYAPDNLYHLAKELDIQSDVKMWDPSKYRAWKAIIDIINMDKIMVDFSNWVDERTDEAE